jgi:hypothetical protein
VLAVLDWLPDDFAPDAEFLSKYRSQARPHHPNEEGEARTLLLLEDGLLCAMNPLKSPNHAKMAPPGTRTQVVRGVGTEGRRAGRCDGRRLVGTKGEVVDHLVASPGR